MKCFFFIFLFLSVSIAVQAKWTLVPRYSSYIEISEQSDTLDKRSINTTLYRDDTQGMFRVAIIHETLTRERIKYIKRMQTATALSSLATILSSTSVFSSDWHQRFNGRLQTYINASLTEIYERNANEAKRLEIDAWIENTCDEELMIAEQERGLMWFLRPGQTLRFSISNPDILQLRVSTLSQKRIHYVTMAAGSFLREARVEYEDDDCWVFPLEVAGEEGYLETIGYAVMDKKTAEQHNITKEEFKALKKH